MNRDQSLFLLYIILIILFTSIHSVEYLLLAMIILFFISFRRFIFLFKRTAKTVWLSLSVISLSYLLAGFFTQIHLPFLLLLNIRVFLLSFMTFFMLEKINLFKVFSFSKKLSSLMALSFSQMHIFQRTFKEFQMGYTSRTQKKRWTTWLKSLNATLLYFVNKTLHSSKDISLGMKSRGFFHD